MKRFVAQLNDTSFVNVPADRMEIVDNAIHVYDGLALVVYLDVSCVLVARLDDRGEPL